MASNSGGGGCGGNPNFKSSFLIFMWFAHIFYLFFTSTKATFSYFFSRFSFLRIFLVALFLHLSRESCLSFCYLLRYFLRQHSENVTLFPHCSFRSLHSLSFLGLVCFLCKLYPMGLLFCRRVSAGASKT